MITNLKKKSFYFSRYVFFSRSENDLKALQSVGQIVGEVLRQLTEEKFIVKATNGPRYVVGCRRQLDKAKLRPGTRVALDMTTLTIMRYLPREVDPLVYNMSRQPLYACVYTSLVSMYNYRYRLSKRSVFVGKTSHVL